MISALDNVFEGMAAGRIVRRILKPLYLVVGVLSVALGVIGIFLPLLPTTPFLLLAAACFARSSDPLHRWLLNNRWFGRYIRDYREGRGVPIRAKVTALVMLWLSMGYAIGYCVPVAAVKILLAVIALGVTAHIVRLKTRPAHLPGEAAEL